MEFAAAINFPEKNAKVEGLLFVPQAVPRVRALIVIIRYGLGLSLYEQADWRALAQSVEGALLGIKYSTMGPTAGGLADVNQADGGADALRRLLERFSQETGHLELSTAPLVLWGHSGGGGVASILAGIDPHRTLAFVRYHSGPMTGDLGVVTKIPALFLSGGRDTTAPTHVAESLWRRGRVLGAPWTFAVEPQAQHGDPKDLEKASDFTTKWITAVVRHRLPAGASAMRLVNDQGAWMGDNRTGEFASFDSFGGLKLDASWLPDDMSARAWRELAISR